MSILIKDEKVPKTCGECDACRFDTWNVEDRCFVTGEFLDELDIATEKSKNCPLVDIPPHGRLIDADETKRVFGDYFEKVKVSRRYAESLVDNAIPTVIESEE